ncbi:MAG: tRNA uridine-5-carboxymethylaminomethyl(34) synthesis GTPase MnmE [Oscillospiraceae bacterium]|nr:tRNA uridine-5-carboxymethylaminomethyl(34) synthesis GTPase MnmE [Oscillospiraceae bacterium]
MSHAIAAVSTGNQVSAIGIIRLSGDDCVSIAQRVFSRNLLDAPNRKLILGCLEDTQGRTIDQCMAVVSRAPHSYTGEDTVEFHCHGSPALLAAGLDSLYAAGARPARRGEFTKRAFLNGKLDLTQAEAVIDLIEAETADAAANAAGQVGGALQKKLDPIYRTLTDLCSHFHAVLDYPDEDIEDFGLSNYASALRQAAKALYDLLGTYHQGRILRQGVAAAIVGRPNVGKSSLLNALAGFERVIVTDIPGTTRDTVEQSVLVGSTRLRLIDTAGIRETGDTVEALGVRRSRQALEQADLVLFVCDGSQPLTPEDREIMDACCQAPHAIALVNKVDLGRVVEPGDLPFLNVICTSLPEGRGLDQLADVIDLEFQGETPCDGSILTNSRQFDACRRAYEAMLRALKGLQLGLTPDAVLTDVEEAMEAMGEVTGATVREDITARIFERFCVGK